MVGMRPSRRVPRNGSARCRAISCRSPAAINTRRACAISGAAGAGPRTRRPVRSNSCTPSACSATPTCALSDGCATWHASAARRKLPHSATAMMYWSWRSESGNVDSRFIGSDYQSETYVVLDLWIARRDTRRHHGQRTEMPVFGHSTRRPIQQRLVAESAEPEGPPHEPPGGRSDGRVVQLRRSIQDARSRGPEEGHRGGDDDVAGLGDGGVWALTTAL